MANPAPGEAYNLKSSFRTSGSTGSEFTNQEDNTHSLLLEKEDRRFTLVESDDGSWLLLNGQMRQVVIVSDLPGTGIVPSLAGNATWVQVDYHP